MSNTFFQGWANFFSGETKPPAPLLVTDLIIGNDFFVFHKFPLPSTFFLPPPGLLTFQRPWLRRPELTKERV